MTDAELYTLIQGDTQAAALYADCNDEECADRCSAIAPTIRKPVAAAILRKELAKLGKWGGLQRVANNFESPDPPYQQARTIIDLITAGDAIDLDEPAIAAGTPQLIQHNLLTLTDVAVISALANSPQTITHQQIGSAREWHRLNGGLSNGVT
ncbi:MAG: hypothetical protein ACK6EB_17035 [Planctomyces sp.]|jgi:hypothetical protein